MELRNHIWLLCIYMEDGVEKSSRERKGPGVEFKGFLFDISQVAQFRIIQNRTVSFFFWLVTEFFISTLEGEWVMRPRGNPESQVS